MNRTAIGFSSGIAFVVATLVGVALCNVPRNADAAVAGGALLGCPLTEVPLDQGYGVTRTALRPVCVDTVMAASLPSSAER